MEFQHVETFQKLKFYCDKTKNMTAFHKTYLICMLYETIKWTLALVRNKTLAN